MENVDEESIVVKVLKYFVHGFLFSLVSTVFAAAGLARAIPNNPNIG